MYRLTMCFLVLRCKSQAESPTVEELRTQKFDGEGGDNVAGEWEGLRSLNW